MVFSSLSEFSTVCSDQSKLWLIIAKYMLISSLIFDFKQLDKYLICFTLITTLWNKPERLPIFPRIEKKEKKCNFQLYDFVQNPEYFEYLFISWVNKEIHSPLLLVPFYLFQGIIFCQSLMLHGRRRRWRPTPVLFPGESHGWRSPVGCSPWGREESDTTERLHFHALEKEMATHSSVLAWRIPGRGEPGNQGGCCLWGRLEPDTTAAT